MSYPNKRQKSSTTTLPAALREELGIASLPTTAAFSSSYNAGQRGLRGGPSQRGRLLGRKEARKAERKGRKAVKNTPNAFNAQRSTQNFIARPSPSQITRGGQASNKDSKGKSKADESKDVKARAVDSSYERKQRKHVDQDAATPLQRLMLRGQQGDNGERASKFDGRPAKRQNGIPLSRVEQEEEDEIAWLEAHLGSGKKKEKAKTAKTGKERTNTDVDEDGIEGGNDGLDDLLEDLDRFYPGMYEGDDQSSDADEDDELSESGTEEDDDSSGEDEEDKDEDEDEEVEAADDVLPSMSDASDTPPRGEVGEPQGQAEMGDTADLAERGGADNERYIPPALRRRIAENGASADNVERLKLKRHANGLLNRLGEGNIESIIREITVSLYRDYSRATVTECLSTLVLQTVQSSTNLVETFVILQAALIASLHRIVGLEFGAHFVQTLVESWQAHYDEARKRELAQNVEEQQTEETGKEAKNLVALLAHLYNLGVVASPLIFDMIRLTLGIEEGRSPRQMTELNVELLLRIVKSSGSQLRNDDPTSLKTIVQLAQEASSSNVNESHKLSSRSRFMLEALEDLKNNRQKAKADQGVEQQSIARMKKYLNGLSRKMTVRTEEPIRVSLKDLRDADKRGKWWLVGAAWAGHDLSSARGAQLQMSTASAAEKRKKIASGAGADAKRETLMKLARQHGMNTLIRQEIFVILVSSQDYLEALEKLQSIKFKKENQRREIVRVLLHCIGSEANYNPYYVVLATRLALDEIGVRFTLQYCLWDFLRELGEKDVGGASVLERREEDGYESPDMDEFSENISEQRTANVARAYGWWIARGGLSLSVMKAIDFTNLKGPATHFLQLVFVHLLLSAHTSSPALTLSLPTKMVTSADKPVKETIEACFVKGALSNTLFSQGLLFFLERNLNRQHCLSVASALGATPSTKDLLVTARDVARQVIKVGAQSTGPKGLMIADE